RRNLEALFFFQAEDGIRDGHVTGVQTCALPILPTSETAAPPVMLLPEVRTATTASRAAAPLRTASACTRTPPRSARPTWARTGRSEERRVGKGCRCRGGADQERRMREREREEVA